MNRLVEVLYMIVIALMCLTLIALALGFLDPDKIEYRCVPHQDVNAEVWELECEPVVGRGGR